MQSEREQTLVHSDVCGKISEKIIGGAEYFHTLTDDKTCYSWVYSLKSKDQIFDQFLELKAALVENSSGKRLVSRSQTLYLTLALGKGLVFVLYQFCCIPQECDT